MNADKHTLLKLLHTKQLRIGVLYGGFSSERQISLKSGKAVAGRLKSLGYPVKLIDIKSPDPRRILTGLKGCDIGFIALHGEFGEDGQLQKLLDKHRIPYTGSGARASGNAMDKFITKRLFDRHHIPTAPYIKVNTGKYKLTNLLIRVNSWLNDGVVVKPRSEGSSVGVAIAHNPDELCKALKDASRFGPDILIEKYIAGREVTVGILGNTPLPVIELRPYKDFFSYKAKYQDKKTQYIVNPDLPRPAIRKIQQAGLKAYKVLGCKGFARVDLIYSPSEKQVRITAPLRLTAEGKAYVLEVNSIPGMTERSLVPKAAKAVSINFPQLCQRIIELSL